MKVRNGFVSNSSTSSFLIYGVALEDGGWEFTEAIYEQLEKYGLSSWCINGDAVFIGNSWDEVKDDETGKQFKDRTQNAIKDLFDEIKSSPEQFRRDSEDEDESSLMEDLKKVVPDKWQCGTHERAWHD